MRKILTKLVTMLIVATVAVTSFAGCGLITTNQERDMAQTVAKVQISTDIAAEEIEKREMVSGFLSYGYMYVQQYGYTVPQAYELILKNLIQNRVIVQQARIELAKRYNAMLKDSTEADSDFLKYFVANAKAGTNDITYSVGYKKGDRDSLKAYCDSLEKYLTDYEIDQAKYSVRTSVNSVIDQYVEEDKKEEDKKEEEKLSPRKTPEDKSEKGQYEYEFANYDGKYQEKSIPTDYDYEKADVVLKKGVETLKSDYPTVYALNDAVYKEYKIDLSTAERRKAFTKAIKTLKNNGLVTDDENGKEYDYTDNADNVLNYLYFAESLANQYESTIVSKYEAALISDVEVKLDGVDANKGKALWNQYLAEYKSQKAKYENDTASYESALESVTEDQFVVCNPYTGYGYVANLLIGFSEEQSAQLKDYQSKKGVTDEQKLAKRESLLQNLVARDQRDSWVYSSYGQYDKTTGEFTFEDKYLVSEKGSDAYNALNKFDGNIFGATSSTEENADKVEETTWRFDNVVAEPMSFKSFVNEYMKFAGVTLSGTDHIYVEGTPATIGQAIAGSTDEEKNADWAVKRSALDDLLFAFSTDPGSIGNYLGYTYSPFTSSTKYVKEFASAAEAVVNGGKGSYTIVATDFGYHIIVCTEVVGNDHYTEESESTFIEELYNDTKDTFAKKYRKIKLDKITREEVNKIANNFINSYMDDAEKVVKYPKTYKDLIPEETEEDK